MIYRVLIFSLLPLADKIIIVEYIISGQSAGQEQNTEYRHHRW